MCSRCSLVFLTSWKLQQAWDGLERPTILLLLLLKSLVRRLALVEAAMEELSEAHAECCLEVQRMLQLHHDYLANSDAPDICYLCREEGNSAAMHMYMSNDVKPVGSCCMTPAHRCPGRPSGVAQRKRGGMNLRSLCQNQASKVLYEFPCQIRAKLVAGKI